MTDLQAARDRMDRAKRTFTEAAQAALDCRPEAQHRAEDALAELNKARAELRAIEAQTNPPGILLGPAANDDDGGGESCA